jgi:hypothetical protein
LSYVVAIVVDPDFGGLAELAARVHVWIWATDANRRAVDTYRRGHSSSGPSLERSVTAFRGQETPEDSFLGILGTVDLHHGEYSHVPPWDGLEVHGVPVTAPVRAALAEYGVTEFIPNADGFSCRR